MANRYISTTRTFRKLLNEAESYIDNSYDLGAEAEIASSELRTTLCAVEEKGDNCPDYFLEEVERRATRLFTALNQLSIVHSNIQSKQTALRETYKNFRSDRGIS